MDLRIPVGAPSADLQITIGSTAYTVILHDNGDGTYVLRLQAADGTYTDLAVSMAELNYLAGGGLDATELGYLNGTTAGTATASKAAVLGANKNLDELHLAALYLGSGAGTLVGKTAAQLNGMRSGKITLNGVNPTPVLFQADDAATLLGTETEPFALADGYTLIVDPDGAGDDTVTFAAAAGTSTSDASPSTDLSLGTDLDFKISVDGDEAELVQLTAGNCDSGSNIATEMQTKIQALGGNKASVTAAYSGGLYVITSATAGTDSAVVITDADSNNCADDLKIGLANGGVEAAGTGDAANIAEATAEEVAAAITTGATGWSAAAESGAVRITSATEGKDSSLVVNAASTADTVLGITGSDYGAQGLGYASDMADALYQVAPTLNGTAAASLAGTGLSVTNRTASGFTVECETTAATEDVDLIIMGSAA